MKRTTLAAAAAALLCSISQAQAATFEVPIAGTYTLTAFDPTDGSPCPGNYCVTKINLAGTFLEVHTPDGDGNFTDGVSVSYRFMPDVPVPDPEFDLYGFSSSSHGGYNGIEDDEATVIGGRLVDLQVNGDDEGEELGIYGTPSSGTFDWWATATHTQASASGRIFLSPVPEPGGLSMLTVGALGLIVFRSSSRRSPAARLP
jgi:hypothetical protein